MKVEDFFQLASDIFCVVGADGYFKKVNPAFCNILGYSEEQLLSKPAVCFIYPGDADTTLGAYKDPGNPPEIFQNRYLTASGAIKWLSWGKVILADDGYFYASARDVTHEKELAKRLCQSNKELQTILDSTVDIICSISAEGTFLSMNKAVESVLGYSAEEVIGKASNEFVYPPDLAATKATAREILAGAEITNFENRYFRKDGSVISIVWSANWSEERQAVFCIGRNAVQRKKQEELLIQSEQRFRGLVEEGTDFILILNAEGKYIYASSNVSRLGYTAEYLVEKTPFDLTHPDDLQMLLANFQKVLDSDRVKVPTFRFRHADGSWRYLSTVATNRLHDPSIRGIVANARDVTELMIQNLNLELELEVLEMNTCSTYSTSAIVGRYLQGLSKLFTHMKFDVNLVNRHRTHLIPLFEENELPAVLRDGQRNEFRITPDRGACGAAAFYKQAVIVEDVNQHPATSTLKDFLASINIRSCWSYPIINESEEVVATLAVHQDVVKRPDESDEVLISRAVTILKIILQSQQTRTNLQLSSERHRYATMAANDAIYDWDIVHDELFWGEGFEKVLGYKEDTTCISWWVERLHPDDLESINSSLQCVLGDKDKCYWQAEYRWRKADGTYAHIVESSYIIRDSERRAVRMVGALQDITRIKEHQQQILKQNKLLREIAQINSHHIRKPLANILGLIEAVKHSDQESLPELLALLGRSGEELDEIIREIARKTIA
ncbi:PAS domain S-box protein [Pedobacter sp. SYSU D00535]|uniref:PAS domain S-box protein n=1 Tax=Pedobacter sp. SYSU D00535 TaxID=2810308 RepID=UPI001A96447F|nr:PAS domain S-box protein [Pedobacter sp. SYSU D00535]